MCMVMMDNKSSITFHKTQHTSYLPFSFYLIFSLFSHCIHSIVIQPFMKIIVDQQCVVGMWCSLWSSCVACVIACCVLCVVRSAWYVAVGKWVGWVGGWGGWVGGVGGWFENEVSKKKLYLPPACVAQATQNNRRRTDLYAQLARTTRSNTPAHSYARYQPSTFSPLSCYNFLPVLAFSEKKLVIKKETKVIGTS